MVGSAVIKQGRSANRKHTYFFFGPISNLFLNKNISVVVGTNWKHFKYMYGKCSKISNTSCLPNRPRQTRQTQIRLLLKKQSDQCLPSLL